MSSKSGQTGWFLEVARGRDIGRRFVIGDGETILGNDLAGAPGLDLADQEVSSLKRMSAQHAALSRGGDNLSIKDLGSAGGTFVNLQRLPPGESRALASNDVIQIGGIQLKLVAAISELKADKPAVKSAASEQQTAGSASSEKQTAGSASVAPKPSAGQKSPAPRPQKESPVTAKQYERPVDGGASHPEIAGASRTTKTGTLYFPLKGGVACRSWDDFPRVAAQRWAELREELVSGRLGNYLTSIGRGDLVPDPVAVGTPDERLDSWLGRLPTSKPTAPELEVFPARLDIQAAAGGGRTTRNLQVQNIGHRLLKVRARVEPENSDWLRIRSDNTARSLVVVDAADLTLEVSVPETHGAVSLKAEVVLESNGGSRRVPVSLGPPVVMHPEGLEPASAAEASQDSRGAVLLKKLAAQPVTLRLVLWPLLAMVGRVLLGLAGGMGPSPPGMTLGLISPAVVLGLLAAAALGWHGAKHGEGVDWLYGAIAGAIAGILAATLLIGLCRAIEPALGAWRDSLLAAAGLWAILGVGVAGLSALLLPCPEEEENR